MGPHLKRPKPLLKKSRGETRNLVAKSIGKKGKTYLRKHVGTMQRAVRKGVFAGCSDTVIHKGEVIFRHSFGHADLENKTRFSHDSICRIYCSTKPYTLFVAKMLEEEGVLNPESAVSDYIPAMKKMFVQRDGAKVSRLAKRTMRIKHLMTHSAGFSYQADFGFPPDDTQKRYSRIVADIEDGRVKTLADWVNKLAKVPLCFEPGERYEYGHSIDILGRVLEIVTNKDLATLMQIKLFGPLEMKDTAFLVPDGKLAHLSAIYGAAETWGHLYGSSRKRPVTSKKGLLRIDGDHAKESAWAKRRVKILSGGGFLGKNRGGVVSTARDTEAFVRMLLSHGLTSSGERLLSRKMISTMERNQLVGSWRKDKTTRWCLLGDISLDDAGSQVVQQGGAAGNYWLIDRKRDLGVIFFAQQVDGEDWDKLGFDEQQADIDKVARNVIDSMAPRKRKRT